MLETTVRSHTPIQLFAEWSAAPSHALTLARHAFEVVAGELHHYTDGQLRAVVPAESWDDYAETWPDCRPLIEAVRGTPSQNP